MFKAFYSTGLALCNLHCLNIVEYFRIFPQVSSLLGSFILGFHFFNVCLDFIFVHCSNYCQNWTFVLCDNLGVFELCHHFQYWSKFAWHSKFPEYFYPVGLLHWRFLIKCYHFTKILLQYINLRQVKISI